MKPIDHGMAAPEIAVAVLVLVAVVVAYTLGERQGRKGGSDD